MKRNYPLFLLILSIVLNVQFVTAQITLVDDGNGALILNDVSPDGKYAAGFFGDQDAAVIWSAENGISYIYNPDGKAKAEVVSNNGIIAGQFTDLTVIFDEPWNEEPPIPIMSAAYYKDEQWHSLGIVESCQPEDEYGGSLVGGISADGTIMAGAAYAAYNCQQPTIWTNGVMEALEYEKVGQGARIQGLSADGRIAAGWRAPFNTRMPVVWIDGVMKHITLDGNDVPGECYKVSPNGKYVALTINDMAAIYEVETERVIIAGRTPGSFSAIANAVSDDGIAVGYSILSVWDPRDPFIFSEKIGRINLNDYLVELGYDAQSEDLATPMAISADGLRIVGFGSSRTGWVIDIQQHKVGYYPPVDLTIEELGVGNLKMQWAAPVADPENTLTGYNVYRNGQKIKTLSTSVTSYEDTELSNGKYTYWVTAVWNTNDESRPSNEVSINTAKVALPFVEDFSSMSIDANYWSLSSGSESRWEVVDHSGIEPPAISYFNPTGSYEDSFVSPFIDASSATELFLSYNISRPIAWNEATNDVFKVELFDGDSWQLIKEYSPVKGQEATSFVFEKFNITSKAAGKEIRLRFKGIGIDNGENMVWTLDNIRVFEPQDDLVKLVPIRFTAHKMSDGTVRLNWADPGNYATLSYLESENSIDFIGNEGKPLIAAIKYEPEDLTSYSGYQMKSISALLTHLIDIEKEPSYNLVVFEGSNRIYTQAVTSPVLNKWSVYELNTPYIIRAEYTQPLYIGIEVVEAEFDDRPVGIADRGFVNDTFPFEGRANLFSEDGGQNWLNLFDESEGLISGGVAVKATLVKNETSRPTDRLIGFMVYEENQHLLVDPWSGSILYTKLNNYTVATPKADATCYQVTAFYDTQESSDKAQFCLGDEIVSIGTIEGDKDLFSVYPNPTESHLQVSGTFTELVLMNMNGAVLLKTKENNIDLDNMPAGVYILKITSENNTPVLKKIIKK